MRTWPYILKTLLALIFISCVCTSGAYAATVDKPQLDIQGGSIVSDGTTLTITASIVAIITEGAPIILDPFADFFLSADLVSGAGSLTAGNIADPLLTATFANFSLFNLGFGMGQFDADLSYTGGSLQGGLAGGNILGAFENADPWISSDTTPFTAVNAIAKVGPVTVVPVPAAVWLFGSGLLGLVSVARKRTRQ